MSTAVYTGNLTDIGASALAEVLQLRLRVRPEEESFSPDGIVSATPVAVAVNTSTGAFTMTLIPSGELTGRSGKKGVRYIISAERLVESPNGARWYPRLDLWAFTAVAGGGNIGGMAGGSLLAVWVGPPWPPQPSPAGFYIDKASPNPWGVKE